MTVDCCENCGHEKRRHIARQLRCKVEGCNCEMFIRKEPEERGLFKSKKKKGWFRR